MVVLGREVCVWAGMNFHADDVYVVGRVEEDGFEEAVAGADGEDEGGWGGEERGKVSDEGVAEGQTAAGLDGGRGGERG